MSSGTRSLLIQNAAERRHSIVGVRERSAERSRGMIDREGEGGIIVRHLRHSPAPASGALSVSFTILADDKRAIRHCHGRGAVSHRVAPRHIEILARRHEAPASITGAAIRGATHCVGPPLYSGVQKRGRFSQVEGPAATASLYLNSVAGRLIF